MTQDRARKRAIREHAARTGLSYTAAMRQLEDGMPTKPVDWSQYGPCDTCLVDTGEQCIHLHTNELIIKPHTGRDRVEQVESK